MVYLAVVAETSDIYDPLGHEHVLGAQEEVGSLEFEWLRAYGPTWKICGNFGVG